ncbi:MAG TPA: DNA repair exonuclease [Thermoanaerobaculia bacterium]|nr:DNA repair exonuclease [Thermoanaerobaculia bacterium]
MKLLATADLHLGRRAARLPPELADDGRFSAAAVWRTIVDRAIEERVEALLLAGDVVDRDNRFFESLAPLEQGLRRLADSGVDTFAVAGNHDFDVLVRVAEHLPAERFHLLGRGGRWERAALLRDGRPLLHVDGWSFPRERIGTDPLAGYDLTPPTEAPLLGLLHTELGVGGSPYAPTTAGALRSRPVAGWVLGHVHAPGLVAGEGVPLLYPGSPLAFDFREPGVHGAWLLELAEGRLRSTRLLALSPTRYLDLETSLDGAADAEEARGRVPPALRAALAGAVAEGDGALACLGLRLALTGRTEAKPRLAEVLAEVEEDRPALGGAVAFVDTVVDRTRPPADLARLAGADDPAGALARLRAALEAGQRPELLEALARRIAGVRQAPAYAALSGAEAPSPEETRALLLTATDTLLDRLLAQKEEA